MNGRRIRTSPCGRSETFAACDRATAANRKNVDARRVSETGLHGAAELQILAPVLPDFNVHEHALSCIWPVGRPTEVLDK